MIAIFFFLGSCVDCQIPSLVVHLFVQSSVCVQFDLVYSVFVCLLLVFLCPAQCCQTDNFCWMICVTQHNCTSNIPPRISRTHGSHDAPVLPRSSKGLLSKNRKQNDNYAHLHRSFIAHCCMNFCANKRGQRFTNTFRVHFYRLIG